MSKSSTTSSALSISRLLKKGSRPACSGRSSDSCRGKRRLPVLKGASPLFRPTVRLWIAIAAGAILIAAAPARAGEAEWKTLNAQAQTHLQRGDLGQSLLFAREALREAAATFGEYHLSTASSLDTLGTVLTLSGKSDEAEIYYRRALTITEKLAGPGSAAAAVALFNLGSVLTRREVAAEAEQMHRRALAIFQKTYGESDRRTAAALHGVGSALLAQGKLAPAVAYLRRALAVKEKIFGSDSLTTAHTLKNLALALQHLGKKDEADAMRERAARIYK